MKKMNYHLQSRKYLLFLLHKQESLFLIILCTFLLWLLNIQKFGGLAHLARALRWQ